jgi:hypothetical protein
LVIYHNVMASPVAAAATASQRLLLLLLLFLQCRLLLCEDGLKQLPGGGLC